MSDFETSPPKEIEIDADGEDGEALLGKSPSPEKEASDSRTNGDRSSPKHKSSSRSKSKSRSRSRSPSLSRSRSRSHSRSRSRSRSRHRRHKRRRHSRSRSRSSSESRSRSRSPRYSRRHSRYSRSRSRSRRRSSDSYRRHSRSPMSTRKRHAGDREHPEPNRCIGVFGLSLYTQERGLREVFGRYGPISEVQVVYDRQTGRSRGFAFVYFKSADDAYEAKDRCNGIEIDGRRIRVDFSITERAHTPTPGIYLGKSSESGSSSRRSPGRTSSYNRRSRSPYTYGYRRSPSYSPPRVKGNPDIRFDLQKKGFNPLKGFENRTATL